jgi:hypothetical protein
MGDVVMLWNKSTGFLPKISVFLCTALLACAPATHRVSVDSAALKKEERLQREVAFQDKADARQRLRQIAFRILAANADLCGDKVVLRFGFLYGNLLDFKEKNRPFAKASYGATNKTSILYAIPSAPAGKAGLKRGDIILAVDGKKASTETLIKVPVKEASQGLENDGSEDGDDDRDDYKSNTKRRSPATAKINRLMNGRKDKGKLSLLVRRGSTQHLIEMRPTKICKYGVRLKNKYEVNAYADSKRIIITRGMMEFARDDIELATVIGHELAHNVMLHIQKSKGNAVLGSVIDALFAGARVNTGNAFSNAARQAFSQDFEAEADYVGLYYTSRAGFDIKNAPNF